jgi:hypothetical protein
MDSLSVQTCDFHFDGQGVWYIRRVNGRIDNPSYLQFSPSTCSNAKVWKLKTEHRKPKTTKKTSGHCDLR